MATVWWMCVFVCNVYVVCNCGAFLKGQHTRASESRSHYEFCSCPFPTNNGSFSRTCTSTKTFLFTMCVINILLSFASQLTCPVKNEITISVRGGNTTYVYRYMCVYVYRGTVYNKVTACTIATHQYWTDKINST